MSAPLVLTDLRPVPGARAATAVRQRLLLESISKTWGRTLRVLDDARLEIAPGELVFVIGANGVGKTTLLRIVAGLVVPERGSVRLDGLDPQADRERYHRRLGLVSAGQGGLYARLTVAQQLDLWARLTFVPRSERRALVVATIERFELADVPRHRVDRLSMGQRQRLRLAMAFLHEPALVLLDEPRNSLDSDGVALLNQVVDGFIASGGSVIWCAPTGTEAPPSDATVYVLEAGKLSRG